MQKFFIDPEQINKNTVRIIGEDVNHISNVLRLETGEEVLVGDKVSCDTYFCKIKEIGREKVLLEILKKMEDTTEPSTYIHIFQGLPKADKMEHIIQKGTEIGVSEFTPVNMARCIVKLDEKESTKKTQRWQKIAETAAKQSKRDKIPKVNFPQNLKNLFENLQEYDIVLVAYEDEHKHILKKELLNYKTKGIDLKKIAIIIGPEGGLAKEEVDFIIQNGGEAVSLGKRILRTETAPLVMATIILYELEDLN